jgi:hypothetical protein
MGKGELRWAKMGYEVLSGGKDGLGGAKMG